MDFRNLEISQKRRILKNIIKKFNMEPLPFEGGYFIETFRSEKTIPDDNYSSSTGFHEKKSHLQRNLCTSIMYLITPESFSRLHRLPGEEIFHFYFGDPVTMLNICESGRSGIIILGNEFEKGETPQHIVAGNCWQGAFLSEGENPVFALLGTTMSPGFDINDYESASGYRDILLKNHPELSDIIKQLL
jgi:uncharacterized protein